MSLFADQMLVSLSDPRALAALLDPPGDRAHARVRALFSAMVDAPFADVQSVVSLTVGRIELQRPLPASREVRGSWSQSTPRTAQGDLRWEESDRAAPLWIDVTAELDVTFLVDHDPGEVESIRSHELVTSIQLRRAPRFDPRDPANQLRFALGAAILIREELDVVAALRHAKVVRALSQSTIAFRPQTAADGELTAPYAPVVVFPRAALAASRFTEPQLTAPFAAERVVPVFADP